MPPNRRELKILVATEKKGVGLRETARDTEHLEKKLGGLNTALGNVNAQSTFLRNNIALIKFPAMIAGAGAAAQALSALAGGAVALSSALAPAGAALAAYPAAATAAAQASLVARGA